MNNNNHLMPFGSIMNGLQGQLTPENWEAVCDQVMAWCKKNVPEEFKEPFPSKGLWRDPITSKVCPVCGLPMSIQLDKRNPKGPDWKCSDPKCKFEWDNATQTYIPSQFITGVWNKK